MACAGALTMAGCETRIVAIKRGFGAIPGASSGIPVERDGPALKNWGEVLQDLDAELPGEAVDGNVLRRRISSTEVMLVSQSPRHLLGHLGDVLRNGEWDLLYTQILSERVKQNYLDQGRDPRDAVEWFKERRDEILSLLVQMPAGEQTPGVFMRSIGPNMFSLRSPGGALSDLRYRTVQVIIEPEGFRLLLISK